MTETQVAARSAEGPAGTTADFDHSRHLMRRLLIAGAILVVFALLVLAWRIFISDPAVVVTEDAYLRSDTTPLAAKIEGYIRAVPVADNQAVRKDDLLVEIVDDDYRARVDQATASVEAARAAIDTIETQKQLQKTLVAQAEAAIAATQADLTRYQLELARQENLLKTQIAGTRQTVEQAVANAKRTEAQLATNRAQREQQVRQLAIYDAQEAQARATLKAQEAALALARIDLGYTRITAPADGHVGERGVKPGQLVHDGTQVISLVPSPGIWVVANFKETQLTHVRVGDPARVVVDTFPDRTLVGHVDSLSPASGAQFALIPPDNATGNFTKVVQRIPVKIVLDPDPALDGLLRPGMSVTARIRPRRE